MKIEHDGQLVSFAHIDNDTRDLYTYYFNVKNGFAKLQSIELYKKNSINGKTYKWSEIFHHKYKDTVYNHTTDTFEKPTIPEHIKNCIRYIVKGYIIENL